jgi:hypothetical protein
VIFLVLKLQAIRTTILLKLSQYPNTAQHNKMPSAKAVVEEKGESSTSAAKKALTATTSNSTTYELPW